MNAIIFPEDVVNVVQSFCMRNEGDESTIDLILAIGAELLDISQEKMWAMSNPQPDVGTEKAQSQDRITVEILRSGYDNGLVRIIDSPNDDGVVCSIGESWFYFGGLTAESETAASYIENVPKEDILREIFDVLEDFRKDGEKGEIEYAEEYAYYNTFLRERIAKEESENG